jgi:hypothetical protein
MEAIGGNSGHRPEAEMQAVNNRSLASMISSPLNDDSRNADSRQMVLTCGSNHLMSHDSFLPNAPGHRQQGILVALVVATDTD